MKRIAPIILSLLLAISAIPAASARSSEGQSAVDISIETAGTAEPEAAGVSSRDVESFAAVAAEEKTETASGKNFYMDIRTNMIYDALALPNIGADFYLGKNFSIGVNWLYGWWDVDRRHRYWRAYGGEINGRWWFGSLSHRKPLAGHHIGVYGQIYTYDFEWGGKGQMGGKPGDNLWDRCLWAAGIEYGFSLPVARRFNIDFSLGLGYSEGTYYKYTPFEGHYVWTGTHNRHYWGPTKLEVALVWLIGSMERRLPASGNQKGGAR